MKKDDFLMLSQRNVMHSFVKCDKESDTKYIPNYAPSVIVEFLKDRIQVSCFNTKKVLHTIYYQDIRQIKFLICSRLIAMKAVPSKMYDIEYFIDLKNGTSFLFESKYSNDLLWRKVFLTLEKGLVYVEDPLGLKERIFDVGNKDDFFEFCQKNINNWKQKYDIADPRVGDLIKKV